MYNLVWESDWTKTSKPVDFDRPFHRFDSPAFSTTDSQPDGKGYRCGCHSPDQYSADTIAIIVDIVANFLLPILGFLGVVVLTETFRQAIRSAPNWVPVGRTDLTPSGYQSFRQAERNTEMELEGVLWRSFQTWTDVPLTQWHTWYDWNFHIVPARGFEHVRGKGNETAANLKLPSGTKLVGHPKAMECEWDCGAFHSEAATLFEPGPMFHQFFKVDWAWPLAGQYFWVAGRYIYDCGHATSEELSGPNEGLMRTELHPCKAIATARFEAFQFPENNGLLVPAIQFMFFASRCGGYIDFDDLGSKDYEFIVDLPPLDPPSASYSIGHAPEFPMNTLQLRPRLLHHFDFDQFSNARQPVGKVSPILAMLPGPQGSIPRQAKIKIPLTQLQGQNQNSCGVVVSLGWFDFDGTQSSKVREVHITFDRIHMEDSGQYQVKIGVNGRWTGLFREDVEGNTIPINRTVVLRLALDQNISIAVHGMERNAVGRFMDDSSKDRRLDNFVWDPDIDQADLGKTAIVARKFIIKQARTFASENDPIGIIDPGQEPQFVGDTPNPITVQQVLTRMGTANELSCVLTGSHTTEAPGISAELIFDSSKKDYTLFYRIAVNEIPPPAVT